MDFKHLLDLYRNLLLDDLIPFWTKHAIDPAGGVNTCIRDDGSLVSRDKWLWSQWRTVWVFASLYNMIERRQEWLDIAYHVYRFAARHGWDAEVGGWKLLVDGDGNTLRGCESIYVDGFAIYGLTALAKATGDKEVLALAKKSAEHVLPRLDAPHDAIPHFPYPIPPGARVHGIPMMFSLVLWEYAQLTGDQKFADAALALQREDLTKFYRQDRGLLLERIAADGSEYPGKFGTAIVPGHVIEDMWFQMHIARDRGDTATIDQCVSIMKRHTEIGWDEELGGLYLAVDANGPRPPEEIGWGFADAKLWWPHTEALYGLLLAYEHSKADWCLDWYQRVHDYSFKHYPVPEHGEWTQRLDRHGNKFDAVVALPVKDPFHLPRAVIYCIDVLRRLTEG